MSQNHTRKKQADTKPFQKSLRQYPGKILGKHEIKELQNALIFGTADVLQKVLM